MANEYLLDTPEIRTFIREVEAVRNKASSVTQLLDSLKPHFSALMADQNWLPDAFRQPAENSGMGGGIATWLLYRAGDGSLSFFALVVPPGSSTPVHDHLAWGLVGLYVGEQYEEIFELVNTAARANGKRTTIRLASSNHLRPGTFYELIPPEGDIHRVTTTGSEPSISLHLLGNDTGCVWRHNFNLETGAATPFRSGYTNRPCQDEP